MEIDTSLHTAVCNWTVSDINGNILTSTLSDFEKPKPLRLGKADMGIVLPTLAVEPKINETVCQETARCPMFVLKLADGQEITQEEQQQIRKRHDHPPCM